MRSLTAATIFAMMTTGAGAQTTASTTDAPAPAGQDRKADPNQSAPGATGAMQNKAGTIATSAQDVQRQQEGKGTAASPKPGSDHGSAGDKTAPGTIRVALGSDSPKPK